MSRTVWTAVYLAIMLAASGCGRPPAREPAMDGGTQTGAIVLTGIGNEARFPLAPAAVPDPAGRLTLTVDRVTNPDGGAIELAVTVQVGDAGKVPVGSVALFPVDQGGRFTLRLPPDAAAALARARLERVPGVVTISLASDSVGGQDRRSIRVLTPELSPP